MPAPAAQPEWGAITLTYRGTEYRFGPTDADIRIGRSKDNHLVVSHRQVSRHHARIFWQDGVPYLVNLSPNRSCLRSSKGASRSLTYMEKVRLRDSGAIALCSSFGQVRSQDELVAYRLEPR
jgi:pSer/pThr/pTyr-binding forkhead associated (FHA) protein